VGNNNFAACAFVESAIRYRHGIRRGENGKQRKDIINQIGQLDFEHQKRVLDFAHALAVTGPKGVSGKQLLSFAGSIPANDLKAMKKAIED
jgi:hypothetical protein